LHVNCSSRPDIYFTGVAPIFNQITRVAAAQEGAVAAIGVDLIIFSLSYGGHTTTVRWTEIDGTRKRSLFTSRVLALHFALDQAMRREISGCAVLLSVEGADGKWRDFDTQIKRCARPLG
jgi:hypothetical protein